MAQQFQEMFLKIILDRSEFVSEFVPLGKNDDLQSSTSSSFYLLLPVIFLDNENTIMTVDWKTVRRCLSSPIFRQPEETVNLELCLTHVNLQLADGYRSAREVENSLVYAPHKKLFYFVTNVVHGKNGLSPYKDSGNLTYVDHLIDK